MCNITREGPVHGDKEAIVVSRPRNDAYLVEEEGADSGGGRAQGRVHDGGGNGNAVAFAGDAALIKVKPHTRPVTNSAK